MIAPQSFEHGMDGAVSLGLLPPHDLAICFGGGDFVKIGQNLLRRLVDWCGLLPSERVLDVGCGAGRAAVPLTSYLSAHGRYEGFDTYPFGVNWCQENITPAFPHFRFQTVDVYNALYNPFGKVRARDFRFPYADDSFDLVLLNSVFTHMLPEDMVGYVSELARVLDQGGRAYLTWFLLDGETRRIMSEGRGVLRFRHRFGACCLENPGDPEEAVAYERSFAIKVLQAAGLRVREWHPGNWSGRRSENHQDVLVVEVER
ncbi:MAG: class I SAM-dependent methyltransferase [Desulfovibrio sp.]